MSIESAQKASWLEGTDWPVRLGWFWFRWRSVSPLPLFALMVLLPPEAVNTPGTTATAIAMILLAEVLRIWAVGYAGSVTRTREAVIPSLVVAGPYRYVRNPLYIANIAMYVAAAVAFGFRGLAVGIFLYSCAQYHFIVAFEEQRLIQTFGASYESYRRSVARWLPHLSAGPARSDHTFSLSKAIKSEKSTFYSISAGVFLFAVKSWFLGE